MTAELILAIDQGTSSTRAVVFDRGFRMVAASSRAIVSTHPRPGWVEQDPAAILRSVIDTVAEVLDGVGGAARIAATGIANQGETLVAWDARSMEPLAPAIVWQCRRSQAIVERLSGDGLGPEIRRRTGLPLDAYFSAGKATWLLENVPAVRHAAQHGCLRFGTVDAWLTARLGDRGAVTDPSTASRTQLLSLASGRWDPELAGWFGVDPLSLPTVVPTVGDIGSLYEPSWDGPLGLRALVCDQQAALAGHGGFMAGSTKATFGTGVFVLANAGTRFEPSEALETSIAWELPDIGRGTILQGGVFAAGELIDWLHDGLGLVTSAADSETAARRVTTTGGVQILPALAGLGAPYYERSARGVIAGLTAATTSDHIIRAALDAIAHRTVDVLEAIVTETGTVPPSLRVDGGLTANGYLMERQADLAGMPVDVASIPESTALGTAGLAALGAGLATIDALAEVNPAARRVEPRLAADSRAHERARWRGFVSGAAALSAQAGV